MSGMRSKRNMRSRWLTYNAEFFDSELLNSNGDSALSEAVDVRPWDEMLLYVDIERTGDPGAATLQVVTRFSPAEAGLYHDYMNGPFGHMIFENTQIGARISHCIQGRCPGRWMKVYILATGAGIDGDNYYEATISTDLTPRRG